METGRGEAIAVLLANQFVRQGHVLLLGLALIQLLGQLFDAVRIVARYAAGSDRLGAGLELASVLLQFMALVDVVASLGAIVSVALLGVVADEDRLAERDGVKVIPAALRSRGARGAVFVGSLEQPLAAPF